jgi:hypothetical protein
MAWVIGIFCALLALALLFRYPLQTITFVVLVVGGIWLFIDSIAKNNQRRYQQARSLVTADEISFGDLRLSNSVGSTWTLTGSASNNSRHTVTSIDLLVSIENCPAVGSCIIIGQASVHNSVIIPSGQMRGLNGYASLSNLPPLDGWRWNYRVVKIAAK